MDRGIHLGRALGPFRLHRVPGNGYGARLRKARPHTGAPLAWCGLNLGSSLHPGVQMGGGQDQIDLGDGGFGDIEIQSIRFLSSVAGREKMAVTTCSPGFGAVIAVHPLSVSIKAGFPSNKMSSKAMSPEKGDFGGDVEGVVVQYLKVDFGRIMAPLRVTFPV